MIPDFWCDKRVLVTGHTGFKGTWLTLWLAEWGARVTGLALPPDGSSSLFSLVKLAEAIRHIEGDIRDPAVVAEAFAAARPEIVIHMAAQSLVLPSYKDPIGTYATNVMGTAHVLEATRRMDGVRVALVVTSDKCYENDGRSDGYREDDCLGGFDPYSSSKGCAELVTAAYRRSFLADNNVIVASARAGNAIGGGDWAQDRIVPDIMRAILDGQRPLIRSPHAVRPWQHVLDPLSGYILLIERLWNEGASLAGRWNFGPDPKDLKTVAWLADQICSQWPKAGWDRNETPHPHESEMLTLDSSKARRLLGWSPKWGLGRSLSSTVEWYRGFAAKANMAELTRGQLVNFIGIPER